MLSSTKNNLKRLMYVVTLRWRMMMIRSSLTLSCEQDMKYLNCSHEKFTHDAVECRGENKLRIDAISVEDLDCFLHQLITNISDFGVWEKSYE
jgi:hypothetical protein